MRGTPLYVKTGASPRRSPRGATPSTFTPPSSISCRPGSNCAVPHWARTWPVGSGSGCRTANLDTSPCPTGSHHRGSEVRTADAPQAGEFARTGIATRSPPRGGSHVVRTSKIPPDGRTVRPRAEESSRLNAGRMSKPPYLAGPPDSYIYVILRNGTLSKLLVSSRRR